MTERLTLPILPLRDMVLFPGVAAPINAGRPGTLRAVERALKDENRVILALAQRENTDQVTATNLHVMGTVAKIGQIQRAMGGVQLLLHGEFRASVLHVEAKDGYLEAIIARADDIPPPDERDPLFQA